MLVDLLLIKKYSISGPRYTSYLTGLQFEDGSDVDHRRAALARVDEPISLYTHLPFCNTLCYYCACNKIVTKDKTVTDRYLGYLFKEIDAHARLYRDREVRQLHCGGVTPTYLTDDQINRLSAELRRQFDFASDGEYSIEIDPRTVDPARVANLRQAGFNRL
jgi:oxygen-independent coproporphyrinogen-3 oxidase